MNDAVDDLKAWRGPGKVRTLETFIPAEHFIFWTMSQFERGNGLRMVLKRKGMYSKVWISVDVHPTLGKKR
jgi:hypothetical protein